MDKLESSIRTSSIIEPHIYQNAFSKFIYPLEKKISNISDPFKNKMLSRLTLNVSHLRAHKLRQVILFPELSFL